VGGSKRVANEMLTFELDKANREEIGIFPQSCISFADAAEQWFASLRPDLKPRTLTKWRTILDVHLKPAFCGALRAVTVDAIEAYIKSRSANGAKPATVNGDLAVLRLITRKAVEKHHLSRTPFKDAHGDPVECLRPLREPDGRVRYLSDDELQRLLATLETDLYLRAFVLIAINTGMRRDEILNLNHETIDTANRLLRLVNTKNGRARVVYLNAVAISALESLPRRLDGKLFPYTSDQVSMRFVRAARAAGVQDFHLHDLRHHFCSMQAMGGVTGKALSELIGHRTAAMTDRYTHLSGEFLRSAVDRLQIGAATVKPGAAKA